MTSDESTFDICEGGGDLFPLSVCEFEQIFSGDPRWESGEFFELYFCGPEHTSIAVIGESSLVRRATRFANAQHFAVDCSNGSRGMIEGCEFGPQVGKAIFVLRQSACSVLSSHFEGLHEGAMSVLEDSGLSVVRCVFANIKRRAIHGMNKCILRVEGSHFANCRGNGVNFEFSSGHVKRCEFRGLGFAAIAMFGPCASPVISDCVVWEWDWMEIVARDGCAPTISRVMIERVRLNGHSFSDFTRTHVLNCTISAIGRELLSVFNDARLTFIGNHITCDENALCVLTRERRSCGRMSSLDRRESASIGAALSRNSSTIACSATVRNTRPRSEERTSKQARESRMPPLCQRAHSARRHPRTHACSSQARCECHRCRHCCRCHCLRRRTPTADRMCSPCGQFIACGECAAMIEAGHAAGRRISAHSVQRLSQNALKCSRNRNASYVWRPLLIQQYCPAATYASAMPTP
jgi:hypothetical protein